MNDVVACGGSVSGGAILGLFLAGTIGAGIGAVVGFVSGILAFRNMKSPL